jgi:asparagine synthase (glutamine-hydrolysing)
VGDLLPSEIVNRKKMGFTLPWQHWMKKDLKEFCEKNIQELEARNLFESKALFALWKRFLADDPHITWARLWHLVVLNDWLKRNDVN